MAGSAGAMIQAIPISNLSSSSSSSLTTLVFLPNTKLIPTWAPFNGVRLIRKQRTFPRMPMTVSLALAESDSAKSLEPDPKSLLQQLANSFDLSQDYFSQLPRDLRLDLNDAAFDLSNGPVIDECGLELGETLLNLSRAWEKADTSTSHSLVSKLPKLEESLTNNAKSAFGKRLVSAGRRFQSMGQYGQGELQKIAKLMITTGKCLSDSSMSTVIVEQPKNDSRMLKFGELQVELTASKANIGAAISLVFGILSWEIAQGVQNIPESSLQYANDNALMLAKSLRGTLLAVFYSSTVLSGFTSVGLVLLARQLNSKEE
uniref:LOW protein: ammonium transporter 1-like protein n=1 Tax=Cannabis sativa TaxID=3483 RepID=A0A803R622_CANSA